MQEERTCLGILNLHKDDCPCTCAPIQRTTHCVHVIHSNDTKACSDTIFSSGETIHRKLGAYRYDQLGSIHDTFSLRFGTVYLNFVPLMPKMEKIKKKKKKK